jgi:hypothetical protein
MFWKYICSQLETQTNFFILTIETITQTLLKYLFNIQTCIESYIETSGYPWPSSIVKSPSFFKLGSCFSFF